MKTYNKPQVEVKELCSLGILMASGEAAAAHTVSYGGTEGNLVGD